MGSKKVVLKLDVRDVKDKQKAMRVVSKVPRVDSIAIDMKDKKLTVIGDVDPITVVNRLRKYRTAHIATVGPAKEPETKKDGGGDPNKKKGGGGGSDSKDVNSQYPPPPMPASYGYGYVHEENPNNSTLLFLLLLLLLFFILRFLSSTN